jgi:hypothetical protein
MKKILGVDWYFSLISKDGKRSLFSDIPRNSLQNKLLICWDFYDHNYQKKLKLYSCFNNFIEYALFYFKIPKLARSFYEIILGEYLQKPHFDIDVECSSEDRTHEKILNDLINVLLEMIPTLKIEKDICIYTSHSNVNYSNPNNLGDIPERERKIKRSYHVIVNGYCHANNREAKGFYYKVMEKLPKEYEKWIDRAVYSKTQQFRLLGCSKNGEERFKTLSEEFYFNGILVKHQIDSDDIDLKSEDEIEQKRKFLIYLEESLIGARTGNCKILPSYEIPEKQNFKRQDGDMDPEIAMEALNLLAKSVGMSCSDKSFPYKFDNIAGPFVILKRLKPSKCRICMRTHQHQNPYLLVVPDNLNVFFHCRRAAPEKKLYIGCLKSDELKQEEKIDLKIVDYNPSNYADLTKLQEEWRENTLKKLKNLAGNHVDTNSNKPNKKKKEKDEIDAETRELLIKKLTEKILTK